MANPATLVKIGTLRSPSPSLAASGRRRTESLSRTSEPPGVRAGREDRSWVGSGLPWIAYDWPRHGWFDGRESVPGPMRQRLGVVGRRIP